jgi:hypothetical protein
VSKGVEHFPVDKRCQAAGLSVYRSETDALAAVQEAAKLNPFARKSLVVRGAPDQSWGVIQHTPKEGNSHHTWWVAKDKEPHTIFEAVMQP